ncbi:MAG TPA: carboxypeptidase-like regulatory domain-containing protein, partial [Thermoanaerobaculia bacterium]|nr:carboxypeptidase-like regulatory domain-containing protein [Thermoanaerobaculia bacterium]
MKKLVLVALAVLLFVFPAFAENSTVPVIVYVRNPSGGIAGGAYVSLVPAWRPFSRPLLESVVESGVMTGRVVPGTYTVVAGAKGFAIGSQLLTVLEKEPASISIELPPLTRVSGNVNDEHGNPIAGVRVSTLTSAVAPPLGTLSELAVRTLGGSDSSTITDASGAWSLPLPQGTVPLLFEATGYGAEWRTYKAQDAAALDVVLKKGAALRVKADRADRDLVITMQRDGDAGSGVPSDWQRQVWARFATSAETKWESLQAGKYTMYAKYPDPKFFMPRALKIGEVTLGAGAQELNVTLPPARTASSSAAALFISGAHRKDLGDVIEGYGADAQGARKRVDVAAEETSGGVVLHLKNESIAAPFFAVTATTVIPAFPDLAQPDKNGQPLRGIVHPRADAKLVVHSAEKELAFPQSGRVVLRDCGKVNRVTVPAEIQAGANVRFIAPAACHSLTLFIDPFEPIVIEKRLDGGEQSLGTFVLRSSAAADVRVVRDLGAGIVAGATVRAVMRSDEYRGASVVVGETTTGDDGWAHFTALPIFRDIRFLALTGSGEASLPAEVRLEPHGHAVVDPLAIPKPAELVVEPRIDPQFKSRFPAVSILNVRLRSVDALHESSDDHALQPDESGLSRFAGLRPGTWRVLTDIKVAGTATSIESEDIELKSGDSRRFIANVKPLVFECHVTANGKPVSSRADIVNAAGTGAQRLYFNSNDNGVFHAVLPVGGVYQVEVARLYRTEGTQSGELPVGEIDFSTPERPVEIKVPEAHAIAYVRVGERPIEHASVYATLQQQGHAEVQSLLLGRVTDEGGRAGFDGLLPGVWT